MTVPIIKFTTAANRNGSSNGLLWTKYASMDAITKIQELIIYIFIYGFNLISLI